MDTRTTRINSFFSLSLGGCPPDTPERPRSTNDGFKQVASGPTISCEWLMKYDQTKELNVEHVSDMMLTDHEIEEGSWARICVSAGVVKFVSTINGRKMTEAVQAGETFLVAPGLQHRAWLSDDVQFHIEFLRLVKGYTNDIHA